MKIPVNVHMSTSNPPLAHSLTTPCTVTEGPPPSSDPGLTFSDSPADDLGKSHVGDLGQDENIIKTTAGSTSMIQTLDPFIAPSTSVKGDETILSSDFLPLDWNF